MKIRLLAEEVGQVDETKQVLDAKAKDLASKKKALEVEEVAPRETVHQSGRLDLELSGARAVIGRGKVSFMISSNRFVLGTCR